MNECIDSAYIINFAILPCLFTKNRTIFIMFNHETTLTEAIGDVRAANKQEIVAKKGSVSNATTKIC